MPEFRLELHITADDFIAAVRAHQAITSRQLRWPGLIVWAAALMGLAAAQVWLMPTTTPPGAAPDLAAALINLFAVFAPILFWIGLFLFIWLNVLLGIRPRKLTNAPIYVAVPDQTRSPLPTTWIMVLAVVLALQLLFRVSNDLAAARNPGANSPSVASILLASTIPALPVAAAFAIGIYYGGSRNLQRDWDAQQNLHMQHRFDVFHDHLVIHRPPSRSDTK